MLGERYALVEELGRGGMAVVWRARDQVLGRPVAIKLLDRRWAADPASRGRIRDEARAAAALSHPHIAQIYDYGESLVRGHLLPYVVMELVRGVTLLERSRERALTAAATIRICGQVASALAAAHAEGVVHRDIKPGNVMVTRTGAKVVDFGIAAAAGPLAPDEALLGTPAYLAPERLIGDRVEPASDVYALGVLLYRQLAGESPWSVETTTQMLTAHVYVDPTPLPQLPAVPAVVTSLVNRCLRKEPAERPTAQEVSLILLNAPVPEIPAASTTGRNRSGDAPATRILDSRVPAAGGSARRRPLVIGGTIAGAVVAGSLLWMLQPQGDGDAAGPPPTSAATPSATSVAAPPPVQATTRAAVTRKPRPAPATKRAVTKAPAKKKAPSPATRPGPRTFDSTGGAVTARCADDTTAEMVSWEPVKPYKVDQVAAGPAPTAVIVFKHGKDRVRVAVTCDGGRPSAATSAA
jgi:hypothetical protein